MGLGHRLIVDDWCARTGMLIVDLIFEFMAVVVIGMRGFELGQDHYGGRSRWE